MKRGPKVLLSIIFVVSFCMSGYSQQRIIDAGSDNAIIDSLVRKGVIFDEGKPAPQIEMTREQALEFLVKKYQPQQWNNMIHPFRTAIGRLIDEVSLPVFDSTKQYLIRFPYDSISIPWYRFYVWEPVMVKAPEQSSVLTDTLQVPEPVDISAVQDSTGVIIFPVLRQEPADVLSERLRDTTFLIMVDTLRQVSSTHPGFPFRYYNHPYQADSIRVAVRQLIDYLEARDSSIIYFTGIRNDAVPVWINSRSGDAVRFWLKNELYDSVTVWIGNPARNTIGLYLEQGVNFRRPVMQGNYAGPSVVVQSPDRTRLVDVTKIAIKQEFWKFRTESAFTLNQASVTNWVKGGESNISFSSDITWYADYNNKPLKLSSNNFARLKYGLMVTGFGENRDVRKNLDLLETNSKLNHKAFGKFDFSGIMLFKTQLAAGYNYPNDSVPVSKFLNPAILTVGLGLDYKPDKNTSINFSPFSYKGTFVPDTAGIDQTKYGIPADRRSKNEPGASFLISNKFNPRKNISVTNRLQLFTNYINNPQNIDVDWEVIISANLNWFTDVRLNTHLIFDDDTKTVVRDKEKNPVLLPDGTQKKTARIQFKELLGFSFVFRF
ncbi:MAG: DUF3078 domain-containing protein [Bacteroidales bacterium]